MKCPKCGYLGFESVDRCRNCGYDFSLSTASPRLELPELSIRVDADPNPLDDLTLIDAATAMSTAASMSDPGADLDRFLGAPDPQRRNASDLPLFTRAVPADEPLITRASPPRPPLSVRRATPDIQRARAAAIDQPRPQSLDLSLDLDAPSLAASTVVSPGVRAHREPWPDPRERAETAGVGARLAAVAIDLLILAAIDLVVVYFTLQICGITIDDVDIVPKGPLLAFLLVQNGGYLVAFTAGGQTLGKMAAGIRVVSAGAGDSLDLGRALMRTLVWLVLAVPAGLGFLTLLGRDRRGLHDRFAGTRVVRASA